MLTLRDFLVQRALIPPDRIDALLLVLEEHWVTDVAALTKCLATLEKHLPAAAFVAIQYAVLHGGSNEAQPRLANQHDDAVEIPLSALGASSSSTGATPPPPPPPPPRTPSHAPHAEQQQQLRALGAPLPQ